MTFRDANVEVNVRRDCGAEAGVAEGSAFRLPATVVTELIATRSLSDVAFRPTSRWTECFGSEISGLSTVLSSQRTAHQRPPEN